jgi:CRP-like cAMP-binding protein
MEAAMLADRLRPGAETPSGEARNGRLELGHPPARSEAMDMLSRQELLKGLGSDDLSAIAGVCRPRCWPSRMVIFQRGDDGREMILITKGRVRLSVLSRDGRELALRHAGPGSLIGEIAVLQGGERSADATCVTDVRAMAIQASDLKRIIDARPRIAMAVIEFLCERLRKTTDQLESIALYGLEARLARLLLSLAGRDGNTGRDMISLDLSLSQSEIADMIGASRPRVNVALSKLEESRAIRRVRGLIMCDIGRLSTHADGGGW